MVLHEQGPEQQYKPVKFTGQDDGAPKGGKTAPSKIVITVREQRDQGMSQMVVACGLWNGPLRLLDSQG